MKCNKTEIQRLSQEIISLTYMYLAWQISVRLMLVFDELIICFHNGKPLVIFIHLFIVDVIQFWEYPTYPMCSNGPLIKFANCPHYYIGR